MELCLRHEPSVEFKKLLARPQIDEDGRLYANAYDNIGIPGRRQFRSCSNILQADISAAIVDVQTEATRRQRGRARSPESDSPSPKKPEKAERLEKPEQREKALLVAHNSVGFPKPPEVAEGKCSCSHPDSGS